MIGYRFKMSAVFDPENMKQIYENKIKETNRTGSDSLGVDRLDVWLAMALLVSPRKRLVVTVVAVVFVVVLLQTFRLFSDKIAYRDVPHDPIELAVYYEALCPDSKHFFVHHLEHVFNKLRDDITIQLIPYGKAKTFTNQEGDINFQCQHGEVECYANKIHACVINIIPDTASHLPIAVCMIKDNADPDAALMRCTLPDDQASVSECTKGSYGSELLKAHGIKTSVVRPSFIPTVYVGGSKGDQAALLKNLMTELCKYFPSSRKPAACP